MRCYQGYCPSENMEDNVYRFKFFLTALVIGTIAAAVLYGYATANAAGIL